MTHWQIMLSLAKEPTEDNTQLETALTQEINTLSQNVLSYLLQGNGINNYICIDRNTLYIDTFLSVQTISTVLNMVVYNRCASELIGENMNVGTIAS